MRSLYIHHGSSWQYTRPLLGQPGPQDSITYQSLQQGNQWTVWERQVQIHKVQVDRILSRSRGFCGYIWLQHICTGCYSKISSKFIHCIQEHHPFLHFHHPVHDRLPLWKLVVQQLIISSVTSTNYRLWSSTRVCRKNRSWYPSSASVPKLWAYGSIILWTLRLNPSEIPTPSTTKMTELLCSL